MLDIKDIDGKWTILGSSMTSGKPADVIFEQYHTSKNQHNFTNENLSGLVSLNRRSFTLFNKTFLIRKLLNY